MNLNQFDSKDRTFSFSFAMCGNRSAMCFDQELADRQSKAQAAKLTGYFQTLLEWLETMFYLFRSHSDPGVLDRDGDPPVSIRCSNDNPPVFGREFDRIFKNVPQYLLNARRIALD